MNADTDSTISKAEVEAAEIRVAGYSWGGIQAVNFTWHLGRSGNRPAGYKLNEPVKIKKLLTLDPENSWFIFKHTRGAVRSNVEAFANYYQDLAVDSEIPLYYLVGGGKGAPYKLDYIWADSPLNITGDPISAEAGVQKTEVRIDQVWPNVLTAREFYKTNNPTETHYWGEMYGSTINHSTLPWWNFDRSVAFLG